MSVSGSKSFLLSSSPLYGEEEPPRLVEKQGIVSILGSDIEKGSKAASLRRTLSADMSSKKWLAQNGMKKIASSQHLAMTTIDSSSSEEEEEEEEEYGQLVKEKRIENPRQSDIWSTIISQKAADDDASKLPPPYVHPLVKRSASSLSEKSLEICTESLGSETGSDVFSSYPPSEIGDADEEKEEQQVVQLQEKEKDSSEFFDREEFQVVKYNYSTTKKSPPTRSFPPPLPSLARSDGPSLHMHSHRQNGRLVLEAVAIPSQNYFQAQRRNGRLLLTLVNNPLDESTPAQSEEAKVEDQFEEVFDISEEENDEDEDEEEVGEEEEEVEEEEEEEMIETNVYRSAPKLASEVINVHRSALMMKKLMEIENRNPTWPSNCKFNKAVNSVKLEAEMETDVRNPEDQTKIPPSLPSPPQLVRIIPAPPVAGAANSYEYFWRAKPTVASVINNNPVASTQQSSLPLKNNYYSNKGYEQKDLVLLRGNKADYLVPLLRSCKEPRRSLLLLEPHCIATS